MINVADINALIQWIQSQQLILGFPNITVNFKDRHNEITNLLNDLRIGGVRIIYGPLGAGKTTLLNLLAKSLRAVGVGDTAVIYVNYESRVTNIIMPGALSISGLVNDLLNRLSATIMGVTVGVGQVIELAKALWNYIRELHGVNNVLIIHDDLDRWFMSGGVGRGAVQELITMYAGEFEGKPLGEAPWGDKYVKVFISISDQSAVELAWRYRGKGGLMTMLLWNLPRDAFLDVVHDVKRQLMSNVDIEHSLLWQLLGGNVRALMDLATNYNWDLGTWLKGIINHVRNLMYREALILNLPDVSALIARIRSKVSEPRPDDLIYGAMLNDEPLIEDNVLIRIIGKPLSQLPSEEWVGGDYAYQLPAYYWVLRAMINKGSVNITGEEVVNELTKYLHK